MEYCSLHKCLIYLSICAAVRNTLECIVFYILMCDLKLKIYTTGPMNINSKCCIINFISNRESSIMISPIYLMIGLLELTDLFHSIYIGTFRNGLIHRCDKEKHCNIS